MKLWISLTCALALMVSTNSPSEAKVYKWKDENGVVNFTDSPNKVPRKYRPIPKKKILPPSRSFKSNSSGTRSGSNSFKGDKEFSKGMEKMGEAMGDALGKGMQKMGEELGKAFEGMGELMVVAAENSPDEMKTSFNSPEEESEYKIQQVLLGAFIMCQFQYIVEKSKTCTKGFSEKKSKNGWKIDKDSKAYKELKHYDFKIDPRKNTRQNLLIRAYHKESGPVYEINHRGKKSIKKSANQKRT